MCWLNWELRRVCSRISRKAMRLLVRRLLSIPMMPGCGSTGAWRAGSLYALGGLCGKLRVLDFTLDQLIEQEDLFQQGLKFMEAWKWEEAGQAFQASIDLGDCLPQPWGNLGICLLMQERYDEAEAALKRALVIDPTYTLAKDNLELLADTRRTGLPDTVAINQPFKGSKLKQTITYIRE